MTQPWLASLEAYRAFYDTERVSEATPQGRYMEFFTPKPGESIVDLGCGTGPNVEHFAREGHEITGVECGRPFLLQAKKRLEGLNGDAGKATLVEALIEEWTPDREYDWALLTEVLEHVIDPVACLKVARAAARQLFVIAPTIRVGTYPHVRGIKPYSLNLWLQEAGWMVRWMAVRETFLGVRYYQVLCEAH